MNRISPTKKQNRKDYIIHLRKPRSLDALNRDKLLRLKSMEQPNFTTANFKPEMNPKEMHFQLRLRGNLLQP